jgi:hypothetical protein
MLEMKQIHSPLTVFPSGQTTRGEQMLEAFIETDTRSKALLRPPQGLVWRFPEPQRPNPGLSNCLDQKRLTCKS